MRQCSWCFSSTRSGVRFFLNLEETKGDDIRFTSVCSTCLNPDKKNARLISFLEKTFARPELSESDIEDMVTVALVMEN